MDPLGALASIFVGWHRTGKLDSWAQQVLSWLKLLLGIFLSFFLTFNTVAGTSLMAGKGWAFSVGAGMLSGAALATVAFLRADRALTAGVVLAVPQAAIEAQLDEKGRGPMVSSPPAEKR